MEHTEDHYSLLMEWEDHLMECKLCVRYCGRRASGACVRGNLVHDQLVAWEAQQD